MLEFIQRLKQRYLSIAASMDLLDPKLNEYRSRTEQLLLAEAFIRKGQLLESRRPVPLQIAVIGPTQAGKSTLVNILLEQTVAEVSPLAGYTVHPHGFGNKIQALDSAALQTYFGRFQQLPQQELSKARYDCYAFADRIADSSLLPPCVLWDTPDFDSIDAADYQEGVVRTIALADIIVLVLSKEKYADQSVWEIMNEIAAFRQPVLICLNKLNEGSEDVIIHSLKEKWTQNRKEPFPPVVPLFYDKQAGRPQWPQRFSDIFDSLQKQVSHKKHAQLQLELLQKHWRSWLEPVRDELEAGQHWQALIDKALTQASEEYRRDYLDHPHHYQTFHNALVELLNLLEIPGFAKIIGSTRRVMTWPIRKMFQFGQRSGRSDTQETLLLNQIGEHVIIQIADTVWEKSEADGVNSEWWREAGVLLRQHKQDILQEYFDGVVRYHENFQQDVEETANKLYRKLQGQPVILNTLRATRATTDATALALAFKTGGIGLHDLILTPAMLTVTSLLAESAVGGYMNTLEAELKRHQQETVARQLFSDILQRRLSHLLDRMPNDKRFSISREQLEQAEQELQGKKHGLRLL